MSFRPTFAAAAILLAATAFAACGGTAGDDVATYVSGSSERAQKADIDAMTAARGAQVAMESFSADNGGTYVGATAASLAATDPTLAGRSLSVSATATGYTVSVTSAEGGNTFTVTNSGGGVLSYT